MGTFDRANSGNGRNSCNCRGKIDKDKDTCLADGEAPADDNLVVGDGGELRDVFVMMYLKDTDPQLLIPTTQLS